MTYRVQEVDASEDEVAELIRSLNAENEGFPDLGDADFDGQGCFWWLASFNDETIGFAGMVPSSQWVNVGYLKRSFVAPTHRGNGLQLKFFKVRERKARKVGWTHLVSDCTANIHSANNFIRAGYRLYEPQKAWAFQESLYWRKIL